MVPIRGQASVNKIFWVHHKPRNQRGRRIRRSCCWRMGMSWKEEAESLLEGVNARERERKTLMEATWPETTTKTTELSTRAWTQSHWQFNCCGGTGGGEVVCTFGPHSFPVVNTFDFFRNFSSPFWIYRAPAATNELCSAGRVGWPVFVVEIEWNSTTRVGGWGDCSLPGQLPVTQDAGRAEGDWKRRWYIHSGCHYY